MPHASWKNIDHLATLTTFKAYRMLLVDVQQQRQQSLFVLYLSLSCLLIVHNMDTKIRVLADWNNYRG